MGSAPFGVVERKIMQNRYVGDIGDYVKLALLRALSGEHRLGVAWWLVQDETHNKDGRHIKYLENHAQWRHLDPPLFDGLRDIVRTGGRTVEALEASCLLPVDTEYNRIPVPCPLMWTQRALAREHWFQELLVTMNRSNLIFLDPDNGIEAQRYRVTKKGANKSVRMDEIQRLIQPGRILILYHHQTRLRGGHISELSHHARRLRDFGATNVDALRASPFSARAFFIVDGDQQLKSKAAAFSQRWYPHVTWHPDLM